MPPLPGVELSPGNNTAPLINAESGQINTSSDLYKLLGALNSTKPANKAYFDGNGGNNLVFGGGVPAETGWGNIINYEVPEGHHGLGTGPIVGIVAAIGFVLVAGGIIAVFRYRKRHAKHGGGGVGAGPGLIEKWRAKLLGAKGHQGGEEKAGSDMGTVAPAPDHYASRSRSRGRSTYG